MNTFISHFQKEVLIEETKDYRIYNLSVMEGDGIASVLSLIHISLPVSRSLVEGHVFALAVLSDSVPGNP